MASNNEARQVIHFSGEVDRQDFETFDHFLGVQPVDMRSLPGGLVYELGMVSVSVVQELHLPPAEGQLAPTAVEVQSRETYDYARFSVKSLLKYYRRLEEELTIDLDQEIWDSTQRKRIELTAAGNMYVPEAEIESAGIVVSIAPNSEVLNENTRYLLTSRD